MAVVADGYTTIAGDKEAWITSLKDYYPFGLEMPGRKLNTSGYRYGFNGQERDESFGSNHYDFGARVYNSSLGSFLSVDPRHRDFPFMSPYVYAANTPIQAIDENGEGPIFTNYEDAQRIANNINALYKHFYGFDDNVLKVVSHTETTTFLGFEMWTEEIITFETNKDFNWNKDIYTRHFYNFVNMEYKVPTTIFPDWPSYRGDAKDKHIKVSGQAKDYSEETKDEWTVGGIFLHEALYHISKIGIYEYKKLENKEKGTGIMAANLMRNYYGLKTSKPHAPQAYLEGEGIGWGDNSVKIEKDELEKLSKERKQTGKENSKGSSAGSSSSKEKNKL